MTARRLFLTVGLGVAAGFLLIASDRPAGPMLVRAYFPDRQTFQKIQALDLDIAEVNAQGLFCDIVASSSDLARLQGAGIRTEVTIRDLTLYYTNRTLATMGGFHTFSEVVAALDSIHNEHPTITTAKDSIGTTIEGRTIWAMKISDNPGVDENEPEVFFNGLTHAREPIGMEICLNTMRYLTNNYGSDPQVTSLVNDRELWFVPVVNPDGYVRNQTTNPSGGGMWRKNRRNNGDGTFGVDLNRNYGYQWGYNNVGSSPNTSSDVYRGTAPFSEPETQVIRNFCNSHNFTICLNYHSYGNLFLAPWGYTTEFPEDYDLLRAIGDSAVQSNGYISQPGWGLYFTNGDADDWQYGERSTKAKTISYTPEVGRNSDGFWPTLARIPVLISENLAPNLFVARIADNPWRLLPPLPPTLTLGGTEVDTAGYVIHWSHSDPNNPAALFEVHELQSPYLATDGAELGLARWRADGFTMTNARSFSGVASFYGGNANATVTTLTAKEGYLVSSVADTLRFHTWYDTEVDYDYAYVEVSTDQGRTFTPIPGNITTDSNPNYLNRGNGINGSSGGLWGEAKFPLGSYAGQRILIRFTYITDPFFTGEGFYVDDIDPVVTFASDNTLSSSVAAESLAIGSRAPGVYYYEVRARDAQGQWGNFSVPDSLNVVGHPRFAKGDVNQDGTRDLTDIVMLIQYVVFGDVIFADPSLADLDNDSVVDLTDIVALINIVVFGG